MATTSAAVYDAATPAPPPPTPSAAPHTSDPLSQLFLRFPPALSLTSRLRPSTTSVSAATMPPLVSLPSPSRHLLSAAAQLGFFCLPHHHRRHLPAAVLEAESILLRRPDFSLSWPFGFDDNDADDVDAAATSFCFDAASPPDGVGALKELANSLEKVGIDVVEALTAGLRLHNPFRDRSRRSCMVWVSSSSDQGAGMEEGGGGEGEGWGSCSGQLYPYVVGVHCQMGGRRSSMRADSGWVTVEEAPETVLVTVGDIAQVLCSSLFSSSPIITTF